MTRKTILSALTVVASIFTIASPALALTNTPEKVTPRAATVTASLPSGYTQVGETNLYYTRSAQNGIDLICKFGSYYYSTSVNNEGYKLAVKIGENSPWLDEGSIGLSQDCVICDGSVEPQGNFARVIYTVTNTNDTDVTVSLGNYVDPWIGGNAISRKLDSFGTTYGLDFDGGYSITLSLLFGNNLNKITGVNGVDDFWFGRWDQNNTASEIIGNYTQGNNYMDEDNDYDCAIGWCWKNRIIPAHSSVEFSYLIGMGDVNLEPNSTLAVTPDDPEGWNDLSLPHTLTVNGDYESPAGLSGKIQYCVEDSEEWLDLTGELESGSTFSVPVTVMFKQGREVHTIQLRTVDAVGNTTILTPISYKDVWAHPVSGIQEMVYNWGEPIYQSNLTCDLNEDEYLIGNYTSNIDAGNARFDVMGVFPYTIGKRFYIFKIRPLTLTGGIILEQDVFEYDGHPTFPKWKFTEDIFNQRLVACRDYGEYRSSDAPGTNIFRIFGNRNFTGNLDAEYTILKGKFPENKIIYEFPEEDITFDNLSHGLIAQNNDLQVGNPIITYYNSEEDASTIEAPVGSGTYDVYIEVPETDYYLGKPKEKVFTFTIYDIADEDFESLNAINSALAEREWWSHWDLDAGKQAVAALPELTIEKGKITELDLSTAYIYGSFPNEVFRLKDLKKLNFSHSCFINGTDVITSYLSQHPLEGQNIETLDIASSNIEGNLGALAACFPKLKTLDARWNRLTDVDPVISLSVDSLVTTCQYYDLTIDFDRSNTTLEDLKSRIPQILLYNHEAQDFSKPLNLACTGNGLKMVITEEEGQMKLQSDEYQKFYYGANGGILNATSWPYENEYGFQQDGTMQFKLLFEQGDSNFDGDVNILDIQTSLLYMFGDFDGDFFNFTAANTYEDYSGFYGINVQDIICTADILLGKTPSEIEMQRRKARLNSQDNTEAYLFVDGNKLYLYSETPVAALDILIAGNADWKIDRFGMSKVVKGNHLVGYSLSGMTIPAGLTEIAEVENCHGIIDCTLSDAKAKAISVSINNVKSGIEGVDLNNGDESVIFNTFGQRTKSLNKGVNIIRNENGAKKVIL